MEEKMTAYQRVKICQWASEHRSSKEIAYKLGLPVQVVRDYRNSRPDPDLHEEEV